MILDKKDIIYLSVIVLMLFFYFGSEYRTGKKIKENEEIILKSEGRNEVNKKELKKALLLYEKEKLRSDSLLALSNKQLEIRYVNKMFYDERKATTISLCVDSSVSYSAKWLSEADTLGF